jgi:putative mRNA 3-end processing factor
MRSPEAEKWIQIRPEGIYIQPADTYLDPLKPVKRAVISHGHADHARTGNHEVSATAETLEILKVRYGKAAGQSLVARATGEPWTAADVTFTLVPAGHVLGSAQVVMDYGGTRVIYSGDYKRSTDPTCAPFEVVQGDVFITEATFGLPVFKHPDPGQEIDKLRHSMDLFPERTHVIGVYSLGKAQRLIRLLRDSGYSKPIYLHGALIKLCELYQRLGVDLGHLQPVPKEGSLPSDVLVLAPPAAAREQWSRRFADPVLGFASGWMTVRQRARQMGAELPLVLSDHADWPDLLRTIEETGAHTIWVTHGQEDALVHECRKRGKQAKPLSLIGYEEDAE